MNMALIDWLHRLKDEPWDLLFVSASLTFGVSNDAPTQTLCGWPYIHSVGICKLEAQDTSVKYMVMEKSSIIQVNLSYLA